MGHTDVNELNGKVIVKVEDVHKVYSTSSGPLHAVKGVSFDCRRGETLAVLGPSGSGKSSLMRMIAGLEHISRGRISIDGTVINDVPPEQRNVSLAFENYALYPAMTVRKNLEFPLVNFGQFSKQEIDERVRDIAAYFRLAEVLDRRPAELSGGHSQMVSLGRALIKPASVHILDEPLSHLDLQFRNEVVAKLRTLQRERDLSMILITHDQEEALELSDRVIVIDDGQFQQLGTPNEIVSAPANLFVADFVGEPAMNLLRSRSDGKAGTVLVTEGGTKLEAAVDIGAVGRDRELLVGIRPTDLFVANGASSEHTFQDELPLMTLEELGEVTILTVEFESQPLRVVLRRREKADAAGERVRIGYRPESLHVFDKHTGLRLAS